MPAHNDDLDLVPFDAASHLTTAAARAEYLNEALATGDDRYVLHALGVVARARGMSSVARESKLSRESLYKALKPGKNPRLRTLLSVMSTLGFRLKASPAKRPSDALREATTSLREAKRTMASVRVSTLKRGEVARGASRKAGSALKRAAGKSGRRSTAKG